MNTHKTRWAARKALLGSLSLALAFAAASCSGGSQSGDAGVDPDANPDGMSSGDTSMVSCTMPGQTACGGACVDLQTDPNHCGACGTACTAAGGMPGRCVAGVCRSSCSGGLADCNRNAADGCETNLQTSVPNCGGCGLACSEVANGTPSCAMGTCGAQCANPFQNCDELVETGCESDSQSDAEHCGGCGMQCPWPANSDFSCARGACSISCRPGYDNCDRMDGNGCEALLISGRNCGTCGRACDPGKVCAREGSATPVCADRCPIGTTECDGGCVDTETEPSHCGMCGNRCPGGTNAAPDCRGGRCALRCRPGFADCDGMAANGCEVNLALSVQHCGACNNACPSGPNGTAYCAAGQCRLRCAPGTGDCDGVGSNGCEQNLANNPRACGACNTGCVAGVTCTDGQCDGERCPTGRIDCDGTAANGCEADVRNDVRNCGACGASCAPASSAMNVTAACANGRCNRACTANRADCDGMATNGCEADLLGDTSNCGACGVRCAAPTSGHGTAACRARSCDFDCERGYHRCGGVCAGDTAVESCGSRCTPCPAPENGVASCIAATSTCTLLCRPGFLRQADACNAYVRAPRQLGSGRNFSCVLRADRSIRCFGAMPTDVPMNVPMGAFEELAVGRTHVCARAADGSVQCFGSGTGATAMVPTGTFTMITAGWDHTCGVRADGSVVCWGLADNRRLEVPTMVGRVVDIAAGAAHTCALRDDGTAVCWGSNTSRESEPPSGMVAQPMLRLGAGNGNSCGLTTNGTVASWGNNRGLPSGFAPSDAVDVTCAGNDTCVVLRDGSVRCNSVAGTPVAMVPASLTMVREVSVGMALGPGGSTHACALRSDNSVVCWGSVSAPSDL